MKLYEWLKRLIAKSQIAIFIATAVFYFSFMSLLYYNYYTESDSKYFIIATGFFYFLSLFMTASISSALGERKMIDE